MLNKVCLTTQTPTSVSRDTIKGNRFTPNYLRRQSPEPCIDLQGACRSSTASPSAPASCRSPTENTIPPKAPGWAGWGRRKGCSWALGTGDFSARMIEMQQMKGHYLRSAPFLLLGWEADLFLVPRERNGQGRPLGSDSAAFWGPVEW